jgi:hypothetical protein
MTQKIVKLKEACQFAKDNGYLFAIYEKGDDDNYHLKNDCYILEGMNPYETDIVVDIVGKGIDLKEFRTVDEKYCFRLHNNFNVPKIIPVFSEPPKPKPRPLPTIVIKGKVYFVDGRLGEYRAKDNPHDVISFYSNEGQRIRNG